MRLARAIAIDRPADEVFAFVAEPANNPRWQRGQRSCRWTTPPPVRAGSRYAQHARFLGRDLVHTFEVEELVPGRRIRLRSVDGTFPLAITRTVEPLGEGRARFREHVDGHPRGAVRLAGPLVRWLVGRSVARDQPRLKRLLEEDGPAPPA